MTNVEKLQTQIAGMIEEMAVHRDGTVLGTEGWTTVRGHLQKELHEFWDEVETPAGSSERRLDELGDIFGIVVHMILKAGFTVEQVAEQERHKLPTRFVDANGTYLTDYAKAEEGVPWCEQCKCYHMPGANDRPHFPGSGPLADIAKQWSLIAGFCTCVSEPKNDGRREYRVEVKYPTPDDAHRAYRAMCEITRILAKAGLNVPAAEAMEWQPAIDSAKRHLDSDASTARALHRVVRAMHDGECPKCHLIHNSGSMVVYDRSGDTGSGEKFFVGWKCPTCRFSITAREAAEALHEFGPYMDANLEVFEKWRAARKAKMA